MGMSAYTFLLILYGIVLGVSLTVVHFQNPGWLSKEKTQE